MENHLICKDLVELIQNENMPKGKNANEWNVLNHKAVATIWKYIDRSLFEHVSTFHNACKLWKHLELFIQKKTPRNKALLVRWLVMLDYKDAQNMIEDLNNFKGLVNQLTKADMKVDDEM